MTYSSEIELRTLTSRFLNKTLPKSEWTHAAHFGVAVCLLTDRGIDTNRDMPVFIRAYNEATGVANTSTTGYHETITLASIAAANTHLNAANPDLALNLVLDDLLNGPLGQPSWLMRYWSKELLFSPAARKKWIAPDLAPLPFDHPPRTG